MPADFDLQACAFVPRHMSLKYMNEARADHLIQAHGLVPTGTLRRLVTSAYDMGALEWGRGPGAGSDLVVLEGPKVEENRSTKVSSPTKLGFVIKMPSGARLEDYTTRLKLLAEANGFDGDGRAFISGPEQYGVDTTTRCVFFYDEIKGA